MSKFLHPVHASTELFQHWIDTLSALQINEISTLFKWDYKDGTPEQFNNFVGNKFKQACDNGWTASIKRKIGEMAGPMHELFNYMETPAHKVGFFDNLAVSVNVDEWFTNPFEGLELVTDEQKINFIDKQLMDVYQKEVDYRWEQTDQECLYEIDHEVWFTIKKTPENLKKLTNDPSYVYDFHHSGQNDWDFLGEEIIQVRMLNEWDWLLLNEKSYSERFIIGFCSYYLIDESDVIDKLVFING